MIIIVSYLPWIILDAWKSNTLVNCFVWFVLLDFKSQFLTSHAIFNCHAYTQWVDQIIFYKFLSFSIHDVESQGTLPTPQTLRPNICNNWFKTNFTKVGFGSGGHCFVTIISLSHFCYALARAWLATFCSFRLCTVVRWLFVPLLSVLWNDYIWKYICYQWRKKNASVFLDVRLCS